MATAELAAQVHKNLGTSFARLGDQERAVDHYREALRLDPDLAEAHNAMGNHYVRIGRYEDALGHFDRVVFVDRNQGRTMAVAGWRANVLFNLGEGRAAFREINGLMSQADREHWISGWRANVLFNLGEGRAAFREINGLMSQADREHWIWPWCVRLVASFGRTTLDNAVQARAFWQRYVQARPEHSQGWWELLMSAFYLRGKGYDLGKSYAEFREEFDRHISHVDAGDAALPWDRLGHWAQEEEDWEEAERCFRKAYELEVGGGGALLPQGLRAGGRPLRLLPRDRIEPPGSI
jgi:tetratricopeptide (TPR) repeat protein